MRKYLTNDYIHLPFIFLTCIGFLWAISKIFFDNDTWFILANGKYILENGCIPTKNPFTIEEDMDIIIQQWLPSVYTYKLYELFGSMGIYLMVVFFTLLLTFILYKLAKKRNAGFGITVILLIFYCGIFFFPIELSRPMLVSVVLMFSQFLCCESENPKVKWLIPFIVLIEANIHLSYIFFHIVYLLPYIVPSITKRLENNAKPKEYSVIALLSLAAMLCNPYGLRGVLYIYYSYNEKLTTIGIQELQTLHMGCAAFYEVLIVCIVGFALLYKYIKEGKKVYSSDVYMFLGSVLLLLLFHHIKNYTFVGIGSFLLMSHFLKDVKINIKIPQKTNKHTALLIWTIFLGCMIWFAGSNVSDITKWTADKDTELTPAKAVEYMQDHGGGEKLYTEFRNGGYFEYMGYRIMVDARPELYFKGLNNKRDVMDDYLAFHYANDKDRMDCMMKHYDYDYMCVSDKSALNSYLAARGNYKSVLKSDGYILYEKLEQL